MADYKYFFIYGGDANGGFQRIVIFNSAYPKDMLERLVDGYASMYAFDYILDCWRRGVEVCGQEVSNLNKIVKKEISAAAAYYLINSHHIRSFWHRKGEPPTNEAAGIFYKEYFSS